MSLVDEYRRQRAWRSWPAALAELPDLRGRRVLDLGCAIGDQAAMLAERGARVIGIDANAELLAEARARGIPGAELREGDVRRPEVDAPVDGIWCSFAAAYLTDLGEVLAGWRGCLRPGGWIALTEVDDLFGHLPPGGHAAARLHDWTREALRRGYYDFHMGHKLARHLTSACFAIRRERALDDAELAFSGPAAPDVLEAWRARLARMTALREHCGASFHDLERDLLACLRRADHRPTASVRFCLATT